MTQQEWESLCDHCGLCCLVRVEDEDTKQVYDTNLTCRHYDCSSLSCTNYNQRTQIEHGCVQLTPKLVQEYEWLPESCAYRILYRGDSLPDTHPLLAGDTKQVITVVDIFEPIGLVQDDDNAEPENHLIAREDLNY